jgi:hypothetical protein
MLLETALLMKNRLRVHNASPVAPVLRVMFLSALVLALHQIVMATPVHPRVMPMLAGGPMAHHVEETIHRHGLCEHCPVSATTICPAVQAVFPVVIAALMLLVACIAGRRLTAAISSPRTILQAVWQPPPRHMLRLFQVMRC